MLSILFYFIHFSLHAFIHHVDASWHSFFIRMSQVFNHDLFDCLNMLGCFVTFIRVLFYIQGHFNCCLYSFIHHFMIGCLGISYGLGLVLRVIACMFSYQQYSFRINFAFMIFILAAYPCFILHLILSCMLGTSCTRFCHVCMSSAFTSLPMHFYV